MVYLVNYDDSRFVIVRDDGAVTNNVYTLPSLVIHDLDFFRNKYPMRTFTPKVLHAVDEDILRDWKIPTKS